MMVIRICYVEDTIMVNTTYIVGETYSGKQILLWKIRILVNNTSSVEDMYTGKYKFFCGRYVYW